MINNNSKCLYGLFNLFLVRLIFISVIVSFCATFHTFAETKINIKNNNSERVTDLANIFTLQEEKDLKNKIFEIEKNTKAQVAILALKTLHNKKINPEDLDIFQFGIELVSSKNLGWNIGDEKLDTGLLLIIAEQDHKYRFFTGYGLEGALPDLRLKMIAENYFPQYFRQEKYYTGLQFALTDIQKILEHDPEILQKYEQNNSDNLNKIAIFLLIAFSFWGGLFISEITDKKRKSKFLLSGAVLIFFTIFTPYILFDVGIFSLFLFLFASGGKSNSINMGSGGWSSGGGFSSSSGFSSFGGGSFGGGGFGGDW